MVETATDNYISSPDPPKNLAAQSNYSSADASQQKRRPKRAGRNKFKFSTHRCSRQLQLTKGTVSCTSGLSAKPLEPANSVTSLATCDSQTTARVCYAMAKVLEKLRLVSAKADSKENPAKAPNNRIIRCHVEHVTHFNVGA